MLRSLLLVPALLALAPLAYAQRFASAHRAFPLLVDSCEMTELADLDGDGDLDILVGTEGLERLVMNHGLGLFRSAAVELPQPTGLGEQGRAVALGDLDRDGDIDAFVGGYDGPDNVYLNDGGGGFSRAPVISWGGGRYLLRVVLADLDRDGDLDAFGGGNPHCYVFRNNGSGGLTEIPGPVVSRGVTEAVDVGDIDGDGLPDIAIARSSAGSLLLKNVGSLQFVDWTVRAPDLYQVNHTGVRFGDLDGDGDQDLFVTNATGSGWPNLGLDLVLVNSGTGRFSLRGAATSLRHDSWSVDLADVDGDGDLDALLGTLQGVELRLNDGTGAFTDASQSMPAHAVPVRHVRVGDLDGDGDADAVATRGPRRHMLIVNDGRGRFTDIAFPDLPGLEPMAYASSQQSSFLHDLDGDRAPELMLGGQFLPLSRYFLHRNDGDGSFVDVSDTSLLGSYVGIATVAAGDVDGDGDADIVLGTSGGGTALFLNRGSGVFVDAPWGRLPNLANWPAEIVFADVDADRDDDLVFAVSFWIVNLMINDGSGAFTEQTASRLPGISTFGNRWAAVTVGDLDGDRDTDLILGASPPLIQLNDGHGYFAIGGTLPLDSRVLGQSLALGDTDGDGDADVLFGNRETSSSLFLNDGAAHFTDATALRFATPPPRVSSRASWIDIDGDGDLDALFDSNALFLNGGRGWFVDRSAELPPAPPGLPHAIADVDGDGDLDVAIDARDIWRNTTRQIAWRRIPRIGRPLDLEVHGPASQLWLLWASTGRARIQLPFGEFRLDPAGLVHSGGGIFDANGKSTVSFAVPNDPSLIGFRVDWQALILPGAALTNAETTAFRAL